MRTREAIFCKKHCWVGQFLISICQSSRIKMLSKNLISKKTDSHLTRPIGFSKTASENVWSWQLNVAGYLCIHKNAYLKNQLFWSLRSFLLEVSSTTISEKDSNNSPSNVGGESNNTFHGDNWEINHLVCEIKPKPAHQGILGGLSKMEI